MLLTVKKWILIQFYFQILGRSLVQGSGLCMDHTVWSFMGSVSSVCYQAEECARLKSDHLALKLCHF